MLCKSLIIFIVVSIGGCATIVNPNYVQVPVTTEPPGATIKVAGREYTSPASVYCPRGAGDFTMTIAKDGFNPVSIILEESLDGWMWGNLLLGGLIGLIVDLISGDGYDLEPETVHINLKSRVP